MVAPNGIGVPVSWNKNASLQLTMFYIKNGDIPFLSVFLVSISVM
jgi:hypothetical protein